MWILECDGDYLQVRFLIDHKTISRKHFVIDVEKVKEGDGSRLHHRSKVTVTDNNSKGGTTIDGQHLKDASRELTQLEHSLRPGSLPSKFRITWHRIVLSFQLLPKDLKTADPLKSKRERLEHLDIKTTTEYITEKTTHVVAGKRNTVKGLQALINGNYLVDDSFIDAVVYAATPADLAENENLSPLEQDFDAAWPNATNHLPPVGKEPTLRSVETFAPDLNRSHIFEDYVFVFGDRRQFENLLPMITSGHGKALLFTVVDGETSVHEVVQFMRNAAGDKGFGDLHRDTDHGAVVMVRWKGKEGWSNWVTDLINAISLILDQKSIDQAEFLDAILGNDPLSLRRSLEFASTVEGKVAPPPTAASFATLRPPLGSPSRQSSSGRPASNEEESGASSAHRAPPATEDAPKKRPRVRTAPFSRFKAFDDGFDAESIPSFGEYGDEAASLGQSQDHQERVGESRHESEPRIKEERALSLKRSLSSSDSEEIVDELLPAATAMKRRKLEMEREDINGGVNGQASRRKVVSLPALKPKKKIKEIDVREVAKQQREAEDEAARRDKHYMEAGLHDVEQVKPANLVVVEEMEITVRSGRPSRRDEERSSRWEERWNGRKNFKKFRRKGDDNGRRLHSQNVIVPLIEVKKHSYGIGEQYWDSGGRSGSKGKEASATSESQSQWRRQSEKEVETQERTSPTTTRLQQEAAEIVGTIDIDSPRRTRLGDKTQSQHAREKRPSSGTPSGATKRKKTTRTVPGSESDSDDLKFRFGRRNR